MERHSLAALVLFALFLWMFAICFDLVVNGENGATFFLISLITSHGG